MRRLLLASFLCALPASAQVEDEAHRMDRLRTEQLNRNAAAAATRRDDPKSARDWNDAQRDYAKANATYQRRLAEWRARVDACVNGVYEACDRR